MAITLYSNGCPRCKILKERLTQKGLEYEESDDVEFLKEHKILSFPALDIGGRVLKFYNAILWLKNKNQEEDYNG